MILQVPAAREAISRDATLTAFVLAKVWFIAVSMHGVRFALMTKKAGSGREMEILASMELATVRLEVGVDKFAGLLSLAWPNEWRNRKGHTRSCI